MRPVAPNFFLLQEKVWHWDIYPWIIFGWFSILMKIRTFVWNFRGPVVNAPAEITYARGINNPRKSIPERFLRTYEFSTVVDSKWPMSPQKSVPNGQRPPRKLLPRGQWPRRNRFSAVNDPAEIGGPWSIAPRKFSKLRKSRRRRSHMYVKRF
jgi:hypothetical protein